MIIWAKLTQGNSRGTCCWITHNLKLIIYIFIIFILVNKIIFQKLRHVALSGCLNIKLEKKWKFFIYDKYRLYWDS